MKNYLEFVKNYLTKNKAYFILSLLYVLILVLWFALFPPSQEELKLIIEQVKNQVETLSVLMPNKFYTFLVIFLNNSLIALVIVLSGFFLSLFWLLLIFSQVVVIWSIFLFLINNWALLKWLLLTVPHWIIEIPAIILAWWLMFKITVLILKKVWYFKKVSIWNELKETFKFFFTFIVPLLLIAAFIEAFITTLLV